MKRKRTVFKTRVISRIFFKDFLANLKSIIGGRLRTYERMINEGVQEALDELYADYPDVQNVRIATFQISQGAAEIIVYGEVEGEKKV